MELIVTAGGRIRCLYDESFDLATLGHLSIRRASHVEPDAAGHWYADLAPVAGPVLGPFERRSRALEAERQWLQKHVIGRTSALADEPQPNPDDHAGK